MPEPIDILPSLMNDTWVSSEGCDVHLTVSCDSDNIRSLSRRKDKVVCELLKDNLFFKNISMPIMLNAERKTIQLERGRSTVTGVEEYRDSLICTDKELLLGYGCASLFSQYVLSRKSSFCIEHNGVVYSLHEKVMQSSDEAIFFFLKNCFINQAGQPDRKNVLSLDRLLKKVFMIQAMMVVLADPDDIFREDSVEDNALINVVGDEITLEPVDTEPGRRTGLASDAQNPDERLTRHNLQRTFDETRNLSLRNLKLLFNRLDSHSVDNRDSKVFAYQRAEKLYDRALFHRYLAQIMHDAHFLVKKIDQQPQKGSAFQQRYYSYLLTVFTQLKLVLDYEESHLSQLDELKDQLSTFRDEVMSSLEKNPRFSHMIALFSQQVMQFEMSRNQVIPAQHMQLFYLKLEIFSKLKAKDIPLEEPVLLVLRTIDELLDQFEVTSNDIYSVTAHWEHLRESHRKRSCCVM